MTLAEDIRAERLRQGLTQAEAAERAGMYRPSWTRLESGARPDPPLSTLVAVARALGCELTIRPDGVVELWID